MNNIKTDLPTTGLKVVEFAAVLAGPAVGMFFAELGAEVIKIENKTTGGDMTRGWKLPGESPTLSWSAYFASVNWGKQHLMLDLKNPEDQRKAFDLAVQADVVISNFKAASARDMGLDAETLRMANPRLIFAHLHSFADPNDERPAFDMVLQAEAGFLYMNGEPDRPPVKMPVALIDLLAAHQLKEAILLALWNRERTGAGTVVSTSLLESALASLANQASNYLNTGHIPQPMGTRHPNIAPYGDVFVCKDGAEVVLAVGTERQFQRLCNEMGISDFLQDIDFQNNSSRVVHREKLIAQLSPVFLQRGADEWLTLFHPAGIPAARIRNMAEVMATPAAQAMILEEKMDDGTVSKRLATVAFSVVDKP